MAMAHMQLNTRAHEHRHTPPPSRQSHGGSSNPLIKGFASEASRVQQQGPSHITLRAATSASWAARMRSVSRRASSTFSRRSISLWAGSVQAVPSASSLWCVLNRWMCVQACRQTCAAVTSSTCA